MRRPPPDFSHDVLVARAGPIPDACGIYFLINRKKIVYVGQSLAVYARIHTHMREKLKTFDSIAVLRCQQHELTRFETFYINKFRPLYNKAIKRKSKKGDMSKSGRANKIPIVTPYGYFPDISSAARELGISRELVKYRCRREVAGWSIYSEEYTPEVTKKTNRGRPRGVAQPASTVRKQAKSRFQENTP